MHQRAIEREQNLVEEEKRRAHDLITDLKSGLEFKKNTLQETISVLKEKLKTPELKYADPLVLLHMCHCCRRLTVRVKG